MLATTTATLSSRRARQGSRRLGCESLEHRTMLSGGGLFPWAPTLENDVVAEVGVINISQSDADSWTPVFLDHYFKDPVVITQQLTHNGTDPATVRVKDVMTLGFKLQIDEWDYLDGAHTAERVGYLVVEAGTHVLNNGTVLHAGQVAVNHRWETVQLDSLFDATPVILSQTQTYNGSDAVTTRHSGVTSEGFNVKLQEQEASTGIHATESVGYLAIETARGRSGAHFQAGKVFQCDDSGKNVAFDTDFHSQPAIFSAIQTYSGPDTAVVRVDRLTQDGAALRVQEEFSRDAERTHVDEIVGFFAVDATGVLKGKTYASSILDNGVLTIAASAAGGTVSIGQTPTALSVTSYDGSNSITAHFNAADVRRVLFQGSARSDRLYDNTSVPATIYGAAGGDYLYGSSVADIIFGGSGNDHIYGRDGADLLFGDSGADTISGGDGADLIFGGADGDFLFGGAQADFIAGEGGDDHLWGNRGDDVLYGGYSAEMAVQARRWGTHATLRTFATMFLADNRSVKDGDDTLYGGRGDDWLFGGSGDNTVHGGADNDALYSFGGNGEDLYGDTGADRFLIHKNTSVHLKDRSDIDVQIRFSDSSGRQKGFGSSQWTAHDVRRVDLALEELQNLTGTTGILKKAGGGTVTFVRRGSAVDPEKAGKTTAWNRGGTITLTNRNFPAGHERLTRDVAHEIAHNWDNENDEWQAFQALSGWTHSDPHSTQYVKGLDKKDDWWYLSVRNDEFVREYSRWNAYEDFATSFEAYVADSHGWSLSGADNAPDKMAFMNDFVGSFSHLGKITFVFRVTA